MIFDTEDLYEFRLSAVIGIQMKLCILDPEN
mgnify:FL=1